MPNAFELGLTPEEEREAKRFGVHLLEAAVARRLGISIEAYARQRGHPPSEEEIAEAQRIARDKLIEPGTGPRPYLTLAPGRWRR